MKDKCNVEGCNFNCFCKGICKKHYYINYYQRSEVKEKQKKYYQKPEVKERVLQYLKKYKQRLEVKEKIKQYCEKNKEKRRIYMKEYQQRPEVKERTKKYMKKYLETYNKEYRQRPKVKEQLRKARKKLGERLWATSIQYRLKEIIRNRIRIAIKKNCKKTSSKVLLGCTIEELKIHLEKQFKQGMTWNNHGLYGWHIDHKIPCSYFDLTKEVEQKKCFHYTNLQPLWAKENIIKGGFK